MPKLTFKIELEYDDEDEADNQAGGIEEALCEFCHTLSTDNPPLLNYNVTAE